MSVLESDFLLCVILTYLILNCSIVYEDAMVMEFPQCLSLEQSKVSSQISVFGLNSIHTSCFIKSTQMHLSTLITNASWYSWVPPPPLDPVTAGTVPYSPRHQGPVWHRFKAHSPQNEWKKERCPGNQKLFLKQSNNKTSILSYGIYKNLLLIFTSIASFDP